MFTDEDDKPAELDPDMEIWFDSLGNLTPAWDQSEFVSYAFPAILSTGATAAPRHDAIAPYVASQDCVLFASPVGAGGAMVSE